MWGLIKVFFFSTCSTGARFGRDLGASRCIRNALRTALSCSSPTQRCSARGPTAVCPTAKTWPPRTWPPLCWNSKCIVSASVDLNRSRLLKVCGTMTLCHCISPFEKLNCRLCFFQIVGLLQRGKRFLQESDNELIKTATCKWDTQLLSSTFHKENKWRNWERRTLSNTF